MSAAEPAPERALIDSTIIPVTRPERLALTSWLHQGPVPSQEAIHVLDVGCGDGANLIALAFYNRDHSFVGLDRSAEAIALARAAAEELSLTNVRFENADLREASPARLGGSFHYIFANDVFSWVPADTRAKLLELCKSYLDKEGLAYINFNVHPGWVMRENARTLFRPHLADVNDPWQRAGVARELSASLRQLIPDEVPPYLGLLAQELDRALVASPLQMVREYLSADTVTHDVRDFVSQTETHGLSIVADALFNSPENRAAAELGPLMENLGLEGTEREAALDCFFGRRTRHAILCREDATRLSRMTPKVAKSIYVASAISPSSEKVSFAPHEAQEFATPEGTTVTCDNPVLKVALVLLASRHPQGTRINDLIDESLEVLKDKGLEVDLKAEGRFEIAENLMTLHEKGALELRLREPLRPASSRRVAHALVRLEARRGRVVTTPYHTVSILDDFAQRVLTRLDGEMDADALVRELVQIAVDGEMTVEQHGVAIKDPDRLDLHVRERLASTIATIGQLGLLEGE